MPHQNPQPKEIYVAKNLVVGESDYIRVCIVLDQAVKDNIKVFPISSQFDSYLDWRDFRIKSTHPDFPDTGLDKESFVIGEAVHEVPTTDLLNHIGKLKGILALEFDKWL